MADKMYDIDNNLIVLSYNVLTQLEHILCKAVGIGPDKELVLCVSAAY